MSFSAVMKESLGSLEHCGGRLYYLCCNNSHIIQTVVFFSQDNCLHSCNTRENSNQNINYPINYFISTNDFINEPCLKTQ